MTKSILLVGVGGQGTITAAKLLTTGLLEAGCDVKMSEIHGMSQRGGTVSSHVRYNTDGKVCSPVIGEKDADILVSFEQMEALRWIDYVKPEGAIVTSTEKIDCQSVLTGRSAYPEHIVDELRKVSKKVIAIDASGEAAKLGNHKVANVILLGMIVTYMGLEHIDWEKIIRENVKKNFIEMNLKALELGKALI
ncbi:MAG: indolepyruvate oxidoreductase subunit beta [Lachnospiraceae bacterium]|nr:indolepyruvate oxidoreductase subunit beta [Lachnospiraceae bacterium]